MKIFLALIFLSFAFAVLGFNEVPPGDKLWVPLTQIVGGLTVIYFIWLVWRFIRGLVGRVGIIKAPKIENSPVSSGYSELVGTETRENSTAEEKMANKRKSYTDDFKKEVAEAASKPGATLKSVGDQFDVNPTLVRNWKIQFAPSSDSNGGDAAVGDANNNGLVNDRGGSEKTGMPIKCVARVNGAVGDLEEGTEIPQEFKDAQDLWSDVTDEETGKKILELLNPYLSANFTPHALDESENIIQTQDDISAIEVILSGFHYDGDLIPSINATAIFEVPFKSDVTNDDIERWAQENDEDFGFAVNFYWNFKDAEMYLDTHSGIEFWTADSSDQTSVDMTSSENPEGNENIFIWHIDRAKFLFEDASEYEAWKKEKKVYFEMDPSGSDDGGEKLFDDPSDGYAEFEIDDNNGNVSISLDDDGPVITAWVKWSPNLRDGVGEDEVLEWGADMGGWYAGTISLGDVDASISEDDGGDIRSSAE